MRGITAAEIGKFVSSGINYVPACPLAFFQIDLFIILTDNSFEQMGQITLKVAFEESLCVRKRVCLNKNKHENKTCRNYFFQMCAPHLTLCMNRTNIYLWCWKPARVKNFIQYICTASTVFVNFWPLVLWWIVLIF